MIADPSVLQVRPVEVFDGKMHTIPTNDKLGSVRLLPVVSILVHPSECISEMFITLDELKNMVKMLEE